MVIAIQRSVGLNPSPDSTSRVILASLCSCNTPRARLRLAKQKYSDFQETISNAKDIELPLPFIDALKICPEDPDVAYYLGKHPEIAKELSGDWKAGKQQQACARLDYIANGLRLQEAHLPPQRPKREPSPTPEPIRRLSGGGTARTTQRLDDPNLSFRD